MRSTEARVARRTVEHGAPLMRQPLPSGLAASVEAGAASRMRARAFIGAALVRCLLSAGCRRSHPHAGLDLCPPGFRVEAIRLLCSWTCFQPRRSVLAP